MSLERYEEEKENLLGKEKKQDDYHLQASVQQAPSLFAQPQVISLTKAKAQLTWSNIQVDAILPDGKIKQILHGFNGTVKPGQFLSIMGPTGCGKTTFMNCLCNRINHKAMEVRGSVLCNGKELNLLPYRHMTAYCQQEDVLIPNLTPREMLVFKARLTLNKSMEEINQWVSKILKKLGLEGCAETQAGSDETRGLSGGERKRTSVALELVKDPLIIFLDEPTTGLDSTSALSVINSCIELSKEGKLVISVIHQPDYDSFIKFDQLMLLAEGRCVYLGPSNQCESYFNQLGHNVPEHTDASEYFLTLLSIEGSDYSKTIEEQKQEYRQKIRELERAFLRKQEQEEIKLEDNLPDMSKQEWFQMYENMIGQKESQTRILIQRNAKNTLRDRATILGLVARSIFPAIVYTFTYTRFSTQTESQYDRNGAIIMIALVVGYASSAFLVNFTFFQERANLIREAGMYSS